MRIITLSRGAVHMGPLILVNPQHPVAADYLAGVRLVSAADGVLLEATAANLLNACLSALGSNGQILCVSGFRAHTEQARLYETSMLEYGPAFTTQYVAKPGTSEHETGLAADLGQASENVDFIRPAFPHDGICGQFAHLAADYGFIRRYAADKQVYTGIADEPWHFRYVGRPHAQVMAKLGLCLEEYIEFLKAYKYMGTHYLTIDHGRETEIFYLRAGKEQTMLSMPDKGYFQLSGNNDDGFIVTYWR